MSHTVLLEISAGRTVEITGEIVELIRAGVAVSISGGKDSSAVALATVEVLEALGHTGPRLLIHADLGLVEWTDSLPSCQRLAERLGWKLAVVRREQGGMMERWEQRWESCWLRYAELSTVKTVLPWSTPRLRFCTSDQKLGPLGRALTQRFENKVILSVTGIRREEGAKGQTEGGRRNAPTVQPNPLLERKRLGTRGFTWNPIAHWTEADVYQYHTEKEFGLHEGYRVFGARRISCVICIFSRREDMQRALADPRNHPAYLRMVDLENRSTFSFQPDLWLSDVRPDLLAPAQLAAADDAKERGRRRELAEARIPDHLLYENGWPRFIPSYAEAALLAEVRREVSEAMGRPVACTNADDVLDRYESLMTEARRKGHRPAGSTAVQGSLLL